MKKHGKERCWGKVILQNIRLKNSSFCSHGNFFIKFTLTNNGIHKKKIYPRALIKWKRQHTASCVIKIIAPRSEQESHCFLLTLAVWFSSSFPLVLCEHVHATSTRMQNAHALARISFIFIYWVFCSSKCLLKISDVNGSPLPSHSTLLPSLYFPCYRILFFLSSGENCKGNVTSVGRFSLWLRVKDDCLLQWPTQPRENHCSVPLYKNKLSCSF